LTVSFGGDADDAELVAADECAGLVALELDPGLVDAPPPPPPPLPAALALPLAPPGVVAPCPAPTTANTGVPLSLLSLATLPRGLSTKPSPPSAAGRAEYLRLDKGLPNAGGAAHPPVGGTELRRLLSCAPHPAFPFEDAAKSSMPAAAAADERAESDLPVRGEEAPPGPPGGASWMGG
jgi:hypothetical protein